MKDAKKTSVANFEKRLDAILEWPIKRSKKFSIKPFSIAIANVFPARMLCLARQPASARLRESFETRATLTSIA